MSTSLNPSTPALFSAERRAEIIKRACLAPHIANADIDAINAAFDAQEALAAREAAFTEALKGLLAPSPTKGQFANSDALLKLAVEQRVAYNARIHALAASLGLDLTT